MTMYTLVGMLICVFGLMQMLGMEMGMFEAVALAIVIGVSVDYIIHIAYAFNNSGISVYRLLLTTYLNCGTVFESRYYKSRAALLARTKSIVSAAVTTAGSVVFLMLAIMLPLQSFGSIFLLVTLVR